MTEITQFDRDEAADFLESWEPGPEMTVEKLARAFAKHREDAQEYWYRQGKDDGIQQERERIVVWLRDGGYLRDFNGRIANALEAGEHLK